SLPMLAEAALPLGPLGSIKTFAVSDDMQWLAISAASRGAIWNLETGSRAMYVHGFNGGYFDNEARLFADMIAYGDRARGVMRMQPKDKTAAFQIKLDDEALKSSAAHQRGRYLFVSHVGDDGREKTVEVRDVTTGATLWRRQFDKWLPRVYMSELQGKFVLVFAREAAKTESKHDASLQQVLPQW